MKRLFFLACFAPLAAFAQSDAATLRVLVSDPSEAVVASATVDLRDENTNRTWRQVTDGEGYATFSPLLPATYSVTISITGFRRTQVRSIILNVAERRLVNTTPVNETSQEVYAGFLQDDWKLSRSLTLNLGIRYEYATPYYGRSANPNKNFDPTTGELIRVTDDDKYLVTPDRNNFGPRLGIAWRILPERLVFRAGYGMFFSGEDFRGSDGSLTLNPPELVQAGLVGVGTRWPLKLSDPIPDGILSTPNANNVALRARERDLRAATIHQANIALETKLPFDSTLELAYVANRGRNLLIEWAANQAPFGKDRILACRQTDHPRWLGIQMTASRAQSNYNTTLAKATC